MGEGLCHLFLHPYTFPNIHYLLHKEQLHFAIINKHEKRRGWPLELPNQLV